jgi:hypothetical protein
MGDAESLHQKTQEAGCRGALVVLSKEDILLHVRIPLQEGDGDLD